MYEKLNIFPFFTLLALLAGACSSTKSVPDGEFLYTGATIDLGKQEHLATSHMINDVNEVLSPRPNSKIAGMPLRLYLYQFFDNGKEKGLLPWARDKIGQAPVLFQPEYPRQIEPLIENRLFNNGYFDATVTSEVIHDEKNAGVVYYLNFSEPYRIDSITDRITHPALRPALDSLPTSPVLQSGEVFTKDALEAETARIERYLKGKGYYFFSKDYLQFQVDSTEENHHVNLRLQLREDTPPEDLKQMKIGSIQVFPDFEGRVVPAYEQEERNGVKFNFAFTPHRFRIKPIADNILFRPGDLYNVHYHLNTLKRLVNLNSFSFVNVQYRRRELSDSLSMLVALSPKKSQNLEAAVGLSYKNSQYLGPEIELTYTNRNLFRGSEHLQFKVFTNINYPVGSNAKDNGLFEKSGLDLTLSVPGLKLPFYKLKNYRELSRAATKINLTFERERITFPFRPLVSILDLVDGYPEIRDELGRDSSYAPFLGINTLQFSFGYQWQQKPQIMHEFIPVELGTQFGSFELAELKQFITLILIVGDAITAYVKGILTEDQINNIVQIILDLQQNNLTPELERAFGGTINNLLQLENIIYWNPGYTFTFDSREVELKRHNYFYRGRISFTGSLLLQNRNFRFFNLEKFRSYYTQLENDFRYFYRFSGNRRTLAARLVADVSYPLGAELFLPFLNFFSVAGPNSVRAYSLRELGPGTTKLDANRDAFTLFAGRGDIHLESSIEYRHQINSIFELAAFADAGNVWVLRSNNEQANFRFKDFYRELGFGVGLGLRLNFNPLVLRLDLAVPLTKPWLPEGQRWVGNQIDLFYGGWRKDNLQFNLSFGYPF